MIFFWTKVYGLEGKTPYIYPRYQVWGVMDLGFDFWRSPLDYHPPLLKHACTAHPYYVRALDAKFVKFAK